MTASDGPRAGDEAGAPAGSTRRITAARQEGLVAGLLLLLAVAFNLYHLYPDVAIPVPNLNDGVLHLLALGRTVSALALGQNLTDPWLAPIAMGYPLFHYYQHLPYLPAATLHLLSLGRLPLPDLFDWTRYLLLSFFPLSIYWAMRRFGFRPLAAATAGLVSSLLATDALYGLDYASYVWGGYGMYTQLWGMLLLPPALAEGYVALRTGRGLVGAVVLLAAVVLSHLVFGYMALVSIGLFVLLPLLSRRAAASVPDGVWRRGRRLALLLVLAALLMAYFLVPFLVDREFMNRSVWEEQGKYDAYGHAWTLGALVNGELFDFDRFPSLTLLAAAGLLVCLWRWREERYRLPVVLFAFWLLLYFGRPTWGVLLDCLPLTQDLHLHRLIAGVHLGGILLMGIGLALPWGWALSRQGARWLLLPALLTVLLLYPVYRERADYLRRSAGWMAESRIAYDAEAPDLEALTDTLWTLPPGRVYAGRPANWGSGYKVGAVPVYALLQRAGFDMLGSLYHALSLNADVQVLFDENRPEQYNLFNVRYVVAPADRDVPVFLRPVGEFGRHCLYQADTTGYFDLVGSDLVLAGSKEDFYPAASSWLSGDLPRLKQHPVLVLGAAAHLDGGLLPLTEANEITAETPLPEEEPRGQVLWERVEPGAYLAAVEAARESRVMLKATYHPNWRATVDGVPAEAMMVMPSFVGVTVPAGVHEVRLEYRPRALRGTLFIVGLVVLGLVALAEWRRETLSRVARRFIPEQLVPARWTATVTRSVRRAAAWRPYVALRESLAPHVTYLVALALLALLAGLPLLQFKIMDGHDALEYLPRAIEFYEGLKAGQIFPRWAPDLSGGYGQPFFNFNPPLFYYLSAVFHALGAGFVAGQNLAVLALLLLAGLGMYLLASEAFGRRGGLVSAVAYLLAPYLLVTLYVRHALADFASFAFIPLAAWGLYRFSRGGRYRFLIVGSVSVALLLLSSNPVALITFPMLLLLAAWLAYSERNWRVLLRGLGYLGLGLGLSAFFWLPAVAERGLVHTERLLAGYLSYGNHFVYPFQFIFSPWGYGLSLPGPTDEMSFALGPVHLLLVFGALLFLGHVRRAAGRAWILIPFALLLVLLAAFFASGPSRFLWDRLPLLQYLEFPWRTLSLAAVGTAFLCGFPFLLLESRSGRFTNRLAAVLIGVLFLAGFSHAQPEAFLGVTDADYAPQTIAAQDIAVTTAREYEPIWVQERPPTPAVEPLTVIEGQAQVSVIGGSQVTSTYLVDVLQRAQLQVNTFYFPGWTLRVDGVERPLEPSNPQGLMAFSLEPGEHLVALRFGNTPPRAWGSRISWTALLLLLAAPALRWRRIKSRIG